MRQQLWGYKVEEKIYLGVRERKRLNITGPNHPNHPGSLNWETFIYICEMITDYYLKLKTE